MEVVAGGALSICDEATAARIRDLGRFMTALYVGGMGAKGKNFYNNIFCAYGYEAEAEQIQDLYLAGRKDEAMAAVPQEFLDATAMVGDEGRVRERIEAYRAAGVTRLQVQPMGDNQLQLIEKVKGWIS
nr:LLM class flavin-dependent oxidoreductase [Candidatus Microthrix sp.]